MLITGLFIPTYWALVFTGLFPVEELVPGYQSWFMSFPLADAYIAICCFLAFAMLKSSPRLAGLFSVMAGSGLIFLGLYAVSYGHVTGLLYQLTMDEIIEIAIKIYCLGGGTYFTLEAWKLIKAES